LKKKHINIIAIVPARSGSVGFPNKNIAIINNKTLLEHAIDCGKASKLINDVYISTDSECYLEIGLNCGAKFIELRSKELATNYTQTADVVYDFLLKMDNPPKYIVLLQPTSPIRKGEDIDEMLEICINKKVSSCVSVSRISEPHPYKLKKINKKGFLSSFIDNTDSEIPRQLLPQAYRLNGAIYIVEYNVFMKNKKFFYNDTMPYVMDSCFNIDSELDYLFLKYMVENNNLNI